MDPGSWTLTVSSIFWVLYFLVAAFAAWFHYIYIIMSHLLLCLCFIPWVCVYFHLPCLTAFVSLLLFVICVKLVMLPLCCCCTSCFILVGDVLCLESVYFSQDSLLTIPTCVPTGTHTLIVLCFVPVSPCPLLSWPSWLCFFVLHSVFYVLDSVLYILFVFLCIVNYLHSSFVSNSLLVSDPGPHPAFHTAEHWRVITAVSFLSLATDQVVVVVHLLQS